MMDLVGMLQDFYAERLGAVRDLRFIPAASILSLVWLVQVYILNVNWFFWAVHKAVSPLLSKKTQYARDRSVVDSDNHSAPFACCPARSRSKMHILRDNSELKKYFKEEDLLPEHGGTSKFKLPAMPTDKDFEAPPAPDESDAGVSVLLALNPSLQC